jgi:hypothetical protein
MGLGQLAVPDEPVTIPAHRRGDIAVQRVPLPTDQVVFYLVASMPAVENDAGGSEGPE